MIFRPCPIPDTNIPVMISLLNPSVVVLRPFDIVFSEIVTRLDFDKDHPLRAGIPNAMPCLHRQVDGAAGCQINILTILCHYRLTGDNVPMFGTMEVPLVTQPLPRVDGDPLDLVIRGISKDFIITPGSMIFALLHALLSHNFSETECCQYNT